MIEKIRTWKELSVKEKVTIGKDIYSIVLDIAIRPTIEELKPCPFCGKVVEENKDVDGEYIYHPPTEGCILSGLVTSKDRWNRRKEEYAKQ